MHMCRSTLLLVDVVRGGAPAALELRGGGGMRESPGGEGGVQVKDDEEKNERVIFELERHRKSGMPLNVTSYNNAIALCWRGGGWKQALELFGLMKREGVKPSHETYDAVMGACARGAQYDVAVGLADTIAQILHVPTTGATTEVCMPDPPSDLMP